MYQVRSYLRTSPKIATKIEASLYASGGSNNGNGSIGTLGALPQHHTVANILHPACLANGCFVSQTFQILYRNEDVPLSDMAQFRLHILVDSHKVHTRSDRETH